MADIEPPTPVEPIIDEDGGMFKVFRDWTQTITRVVNFNTPFEGTGSPEGVLEAKTGKFYTDTVIPSQYRKSVNDVAGDKTLGWLIIV